MAINNFMFNLEKGLRKVKEALNDEMDKQNKSYSSGGASFSAQAIAERTAKNAIQGVHDTISEYNSHPVRNLVDNIFNNDDAIGSYLKQIVNDSSATLSSQVGTSARSGSSSNVNAIPNTTYIDAPLAQQYGMDAFTAYQEALSNTAMQRSMLDYQRAGLNPILASGYSGAGTFSPNVTEVSGNSARAASNSNTNGIAKVVGGILSIVTRSSLVGNGAKGIIEGLGDIFG